MRPGFYGERSFYSLWTMKSGLLLLMSEDTANIWKAKLELR